MQGKNLLEIAQVEKKRMDQSLLHKLSLLDVHKLSLSYNLSLAKISREEEEDLKN